MCGRITRTKGLAEVAERFQIRSALRLHFPPRYNIAPSDVVPVIRREGSDRALLPMRWGLIPSWAREPAAFEAKCINAKAETLLERPAFKAAFQSRRAIVPVDGFFEWRRGDRQPLWITLRDHSLFGLAALWEDWRGPDGEELTTFTIVTVPANDAIRRVHDRMPAILKLEDEAAWLGEAAASDARALLAPAPSDRLALTPVSRLVNSPKNDSPECIRPAPEQATLFPGA